MMVKIKRIHPQAQIPEYKTEHSAGADIYACLENDLLVKPMEIVLIPTGLVMEIPQGFEVQIRPRSGLAVKGISIPNAPGTIDSDYRGEVKIILINLSREDFTFRHHDRIAQMVLAKTERADFLETHELSDTARGEGGFGSTGVSKK